MRLDRLQIELRPRPHAQALDLGFALLRACAGDVYRTWLALWLAAMALALLLCWLAPGWATLWLLLPWWLRPALERAPLYVLSRAVFGERTAWRAALRAWPRELGGGMVRMLTWWRPFMAGRGLYQGVWQLERARGKQAAARRAVLSRQGTGRAAWLFGSACCIFETVLVAGALALVSLFIPTNTSADLFGGLASLTPDGFGALLAPALALAVAGGIIGPVYVACCFTLYLNRRATLEAWDIELVLRRLRPPVAPQRGGSAAALLVAPLLALALAGMLAPPPAQAQAATPDCRPQWAAEPPQRGPDRSPGQARLRGEIDRLFDEPDLRDYRCAEGWVLKEQRAQEEVARPAVDMAWLDTFAALMKYTLIGTALCACLWVLYRYRDRLPGLPRRATRVAATEIGGLDIRPDSLPDDVTGAVRALWREGRQRAALALLYRATLSRLVSDDGLHLHPGATEGDCLRLARQAQAAGRLDEARVDTAADVTHMWLQGAYGGRWPEGERVLRACDAWDRAFGAARETAR